MVTVEDTLIDHGILRQPALDLVAIGVAHAIHEDVGLDDETISHLILVAQVLAHADDGHGHLVAEHYRIGLHITVDAGVLLTQAEDLDVGEAQAAGIVAHQQFIGAVFRH